MKTTVILLALSFVFVSFLNAQNNPTKTKSSNLKKEIIVEDGFAGLVANSPDADNAESMYLHHMKRTIQTHENHLRKSNPFVAQGPRLCCFHPSKIKQYNPTKEN